MAKVIAPFLSLSSSGAFAKTMVSFTWKGLNVMRKYVVPANPQTAAQTTQRNLMTAVVAAYRNYFTGAALRTDLDRLALQYDGPMSGFNVFAKNAIQVAASDADASFVATCAAKAGNLIAFTFKNLDDGAAGDEAGNFEIWYGSQPGSLLLSASFITTAALDTPDMGTTGDVVYIKLRKGGYDRSGLSKITLIA
jgi:hypothetical protein